MITRSRSGNKGFLLSLANMGHLEQATPAPPSKIEVMRIGGVLAGVTLDFTAGARKESPAGTITPLPRQSVTYS